MWLKVAAVAHSLATTHPFADGNKRAALVAAATLLQLNGYCLVGTEDDVVDAMLQLAQSKWTVQRLAEWLRANSVKVED